MSLIETLKFASDYLIFGALLCMSVLMLYKVLERSWFYFKVKPEEYKSIHQLELDLTSGLTPIYTAGAIAPYVGLLGTVTGILITFYDMGQAGGNINASVIMLGLALALKATAAGIFVAIPSVIFYNILTAKVEQKKLVWHAFNDK